MCSTDRQAWKLNFCSSLVWAKVWKLVGCGTLSLVLLFYISLFLHTSTFVTKTVFCLCCFKDSSLWCQNKTKIKQTNYWNTRRQVFEEDFVRTLPFYSFTQNSFKSLKPTTTEMSLAAAACLLFCSLKCELTWCPRLPLGRSKFLYFLWENILHLTFKGCIFNGLMTICHKIYFVPNTSSLLA